MKLLPPAIFSLLLLSVSSAQQQAAAAVQVIDFENTPAGPVPDDMMVIDGEFQIVEEEKGRALQMLSTPLIDGAVLVGPSFDGAGSVQARIKAEKARRAFPRFGVGLHGLSGARLRVVPTQNALEIVIGDDQLATSEYQWEADQWLNIELQVQESGGQWTAEGRVWAEGTERPEKPSVTAKLPAAPGSGKASVLGTPYANKPIFFDDIQVKPGG